MSETLNHKPASEKLPVIIGIIILLLTGVKWSLGLSQHLDILFGDEAEYMRNGLDLFTIIRNDWGPTYNIWYKFLSFFFHDTIHLYYANYIIGGIAVSILLFITLCSYNINKLTGLYISFCFFVSSVNINTWPRISHFVLILVLLTLIFISRLQSNAKKCLTFAILCYIASYARPDLFFAFLVVAVVSIYFIYKERSAFKSFIPYFIVLLIAIFFFQFVFGLPSPTYKGGLNRLYSAFCQHYAINYKYRTQANFDAVTEWIEFCKKRFPDCTTIGDVIKKHPVDFLQNVFFNFKNYVLILFNTLLSFIFPTGIFHSKKAIIIAAAALAGTIIVIVINKEKRTNFFTLLKQHSLLLFFLMIFGLPSIGMCTIIFPRPHYILLHSLLLVFLIALLLQSIFNNIQFKWLYFLPICIVFLVIAPKASKYKYMQFGKDMDNLCEQKLVRFLETKKDKHYVILTNYLNITYILPENYSEFSTEFELKRDMKFADVLKERKINMILISSNILQNPILVKDSTWNDLIISPENYQFKKVNYSTNCETYLLIKE